jgi:signal transduction histidine kinase
MMKKPGPVDPPPRASHSGVVVADEALSSSRSVVLPDVPARWLDRLLLAAGELPVRQGEEAVLRAVLDAVAASAPGYLLGARMRRDGANVEVRVGLAAGTNSGDEERVFPSAAHEHVLVVPDAPDTTLHVAGDEDAIADGTAPVLHLVARAALVLRSGLEQAREHAARAQLEASMRQLEAHLVQAEKLATLGQMAASLVHELNNPLTSILAYADFLMKRAVARPDAREDEIERLRRIGESANRMLRYTRDIVQYARPSEAPVPVVLSSVIEQALVFCDHLVEQHRVVVARRFGDGVYPVLGVPAQLAQVFVNLVTNACHAMPDGGELELSTELDEAEAYVRVSVRDSGHGIAAENLPHVFTPFFTTKKEGQGSGLGLAIVRSIVETHGGTIHVESTAGGGTRFELRLPVATSRSSSV